VTKQSRFSITSRQKIARSLRDETYCEERSDEASPIEYHVAAEHEAGGDAAAIECQRIYETGY
jgi:hypothetical protein